MNQENNPPSNDLDHEKLAFVTFRKKLDNNDEDQSSITPKRPLLFRDRSPSTFIEVSPLSDRNSRPEQPKRVPIPASPLATVTNDQSPVAVVENCMFIISPPQPNRTTIIDDDDDNSYVPAYIHRKAKVAPSTTWKISYPLHKLSGTSKTTIETPESVFDPLQASTISFQPAIRPRIPFNLSSTNTVDKQAHAYTIWFNALFTPVEFLCNTTTNQSVSTEGSIKTLKALAESNRWYILRDRAREVFTHDIQSIAAKISADIDIDHCRINPKVDLNFSTRNVSRQALLNFISSYNRIWFRLAMEVLFPINIENYQQMKLSIEQYLIQSTGNTSSPSNDINSKKSNLNNNTKIASAQIRLTIKNLILIIIFLERAKLLHLIDNDPCLYTRESKFKSTKESIDILSRDFISSDTNLIRRLKLAGFEPIYRQTSLDEYNYLITTNENKLFDELKDGIRLTRCAQILLSSINEQVARFDLSTKLKCPVVNLVHKLLNIDQAFELFQTYGHVNLTGISNKDIMNGNKQRTLELLWRIFIVCYLPKHLSPMERLYEEINILTENLSNYNCRSIEQQLLTIDIIPLQKQQIEFTPLIHLLIKWAQLICAHYKFWLYDLQESFIDGRALLYIISYYLPSLCDYTRDIKHLTTLATCQTRDEHIQFNLELSQQQQMIHMYERNVKSNFRLLEECIKQFGTFSNDLIKYEYYAKDIPDERCTILVLAMLAHDLLFSNNTNDEIDYRHQTIFEELKEKYSKDDEPIIEMKKSEQEMNIIVRENSIHTEVISPVIEIISISEEIITKTEVNEEKILKASISTTTINFPIEELSPKLHTLPIIQSEPTPPIIKPVDDEESEEEVEVENTDEDTTKVTILSSSSPAKQDWSFVEPPAVVYDQTLSDSLYASLETMFACQTPIRPSSSLSQSVLHTMNHDILDHLEPLLELNNESDVEAQDDDSFNSARSGLTTTMDQRRTSIAPQTTAVVFQDLVELEKTIENDVPKPNPDNTSLFLIDETTPSEVDSVELNKIDDASFADPVNTKMIKETLTLFLAHQQQTLEQEESLANNNESLGQIPNEQQSEVIIQTEAERENYAAQIVQAHWRGHQVRIENHRTNHPIVGILEKIRKHDPTNSPSLTLRERMMQIVQEYSEASSSSLTAYLHFLRDVEPIVACCLEIRYLIAQQGLLRLFFILMRCCNRSGPSAVLLSKVLSILQLFTVKRSLIMPLIDKQEQIKDFIMLLLKYYQQNRSELFEQICSLLESIVHDQYARKMLRSNKLFTDAIEYVYKRVYNKATAEDEKYRQQVRSTPKQSTGPQRRRATLLNQSSILYPTPKMMRPPIRNVTQSLVDQFQIMGIPGFFKWLLDKDHYPDIARSCVEYEAYYDDYGVYRSVDETYPNPNGIEFDNLYLDMNGIIHLSTKSTNSSKPKNENEIIQSIFDYIDRIFSIIRPRQLLYIAIDGVAPHAKLNQQRSRRFREIQNTLEKAKEIEKIKSNILANGNFFPDDEHNQNEQFDENCITPGTSFMTHLTDCLRYYIYYRMNTNPAWYSLKVILSGANVPGEGEHKIINYIRRQRAQLNYNPDIQHVLVGNDADLIILGLAIHESYVTIMRDEFNPRKPRLCDICQQFGHDFNQCQGISKEKLDQSRRLPSNTVDHIKNNYIFVDLSILRNKLYEILINNNSLLFQWDFERFIDDWIFICLLIGNDFLPDLPSFDIYENSIDDLLMIYLQLVPEFNDYLTKNGQLKIELFQRILTVFSKNEDENFKKWHQKSQQWLNNNQLSKTQTKPSVNLDEIKTQIKTPILQQFKPPSFRLPSTKKPNEVTLSKDQTQQTTKREITNLSEEHHDPNDYVRLWEEGWHERYYNTKFKVDKDQLNEYRLQVIEEYVRGLCWVLQYYYHDIPSWDWYYPYHYAPFASDFNYLKTISIEFNENSKPCQPLEQLISVLPPQCAKYLPEKWQSLVLDKDSPIHDLYPLSFSIDPNGKRYKSHYTILLPFVDEKRLHKILEDKFSLLTPEERKQNEIENDLLFIYSRTEAYTSLRQLFEINNGNNKITYDNPLDISTVIGILGCIWRDGNDNRIKLIDKSIKAPIPNYRNISDNQVMCVKYR